MKTNKIMTILFLLFAIVISSSCKKKDTIDNIVPATQIGANTFGCIINGAIIKVTGKGGFLASDGIDGVSYLDEFYISIVTENPRRDINISIRFSHQPGIFPIYIKDKNFVTLIDDVVANGTLIGGDNYYESNEKSKGTIQITKVDSAVLAGRFTFDLYNKKGESIKLTDGRFDISLQ